MEKIGCRLCIENIIIMESNQILQTDYLDLVFANRNKLYGGYALRKGYNNRALVAVGVVMTLLATAFLANKLFATETAAPVAISTDKPVIELTDFEVLPPIPEPELPKPEPTQAAPPPVAATEKFASPEVVDNHKVKPEDAPPDLKSLADKLVGPVSNPGQDGGEVAALTKDIPKVTGNGQQQKSTDKGNGIGRPEEPTRAPDVMPEFPGGRKGLQDYLSRNIQYPQMAMESAIEGQVMVTFVVDENGAVTDARIVKHLGGGCDRESLRVVNAMPRWKPGVKNNKPVKVYYSVPVTFKMQ